MKQQRTQFKTKQTMKQYDKNSFEALFYLN